MFILPNFYKNKQPKILLCKILECWMYGGMDGWKWQKQQNGRNLQSKLER